MLEAERENNNELSLPIDKKEDLDTQPPMLDHIAPELRRSTRAYLNPLWMNDFVCNYSTTQAPPTISAITSAHAVFVASGSSLREPQTYNQAATQSEWINAMKAEIQALHNNQTWDITPLPLDKRTIGCRWIYKLKLKPDGMVHKHKARLVAKGYNQIEWVDFFEKFSPVAKVVMVRTLLAAAASAGWHIHQLDVNNAFLYGYMDEDLYIDAPEGYSVPPGHVCRLKKSLLWSQTSITPVELWIHFKDAVFWYNLRMTIVCLPNLLMQVLLHC
ncbi:UNVERIFIED_CONTAM: hypothetical protein Slati_0159600 [Sesamum latifolium]|uniref:Reverse transcriptase Ty1/copia-type domain-containing protein n=1 Tax=Sesamum latifolium TaxID=2727402 RepID=A0AAW2YB93_9LAMI